MRAALVVATLIVASIVPAARAADTSDTKVPTLTLFGSLAEARKHCPNDTVVRIVLPEGFYLHGDRGFGGTSLHQAFVCRGEATTVFTPAR